MTLITTLEGPFAAPGLPLVPGWADDFNRPDSTTLGATSLWGRPWQTSLSVSGADALPRITGQQLAAAGSTGYSVAFADALAADVLVEATIAYADTTLSLTPNLRLAARVVGADPAHFVSLRWSNTDGIITLDSYVPGETRVTVASAPLGDLNGHRIGLQAVGDTFSALLDGVEVIPATTITGLAGITTHGIQANNSSNMVRLDDLTVTPV